MWNLNRRMWTSYMQRMNELNPHSVNTKMNSLAYNKKLKRTFEWEPKVNLMDWISEQ